MPDQYYRSTLTGQQLDEALAKLGQVDSAVQQAEAAAAEAQGYADSINPAGFATASQGKKADTAVQPSDILNLVYPVGAIYISYNSTSPATLFGGSWTRIQGRFLLAADSTHAAGSTGGEEEHTLTAAELPANAYGLYYWLSRNVDSLYQPGLDSTIAGFTNTGAMQYAGNMAGGDQPHNNMPPYLAVYMWRRTA